MRTYNKGEWSELYTLLSIFAHNRIPVADENLNPSEAEYEFLQILRDDTGRRLIYDLEHEGSVIICEKLGQAIKTISTYGLSEKVKIIFQRIKDGSDTFAIPEATPLLEEFGLNLIKANSYQKTDIDAVVRDRVAIKQELGFSIKSQIGNPATLLNSSRHTNFVFEVHGFNGNLSDVNSIESKSKIRDRIQYIIEHSGRFTFYVVESHTFSGNLKTIDTLMPSILAEMLLRYYSGEGTTIKELAESGNIGAKYGLDQKSISFKIKNLLRAIALGMIPSREWDTYLSAYGGYIIVKEDGSLVCYHLYNDDKFKDYLYNNTRLDTPSASRHNFGTLYGKDGRLFFDLNIQIRFIK